MSSVTSHSLQPSGYLMQSTAVRHRESAPSTASDLSCTYPDAVVASSQPFGWQNLRALEMRQTISEWTTPPLENHCLIIQLGNSIEVAARIGEESFEQMLEPGAITIVPAGLAMHWQFYDTAQNDTLHLYLDPQFLRTAAESIDVDYSQITIAPLFGIRDEHIHHIAMSLHHELKDANVMGRLYADSLASVLAMQMVRLYSYFKDLRTSRGGMAPRKLRKAIEFINNNLDDELSVGLAAVADEVRMSYFHFARSFKQSMGVSPNVYVTKQRIERAKKLLSETDLRIADIALRTGFASQSHFTTTFRKLVWTTPKAFRDSR
jgi:AraC family transcriptional regulator